MKFKQLKPMPVAAGIAVLAIAVPLAYAVSGKPAAAPVKEAALQTVTAERPQGSDWQQGFAANGSIAAWQEAIIGSELGGLRLAEVNVNVGDRVRRGQVLARFFSDSVRAELQSAQAALEEARAGLAEAQANADGARLLQSSGAISNQQSTQYLTAERSARARVRSAEARVEIEQIRLRQTSVLAPDDGLISARGATVGAVSGAGQELFRMIRGGRLEWRAEVGADTLLRIAPGQAVEVRATNGTVVRGKVRSTAPAVDPASRQALVYVDLPLAAGLRAGMFGTGQFQLGSSAALTVPQGAVITRDGHSYVFVIGADGRVSQTRVETGRRVDNRVELLKGVPATALLVNQGAGFLANGDQVRVATAMSSSKIAAR